MTEPADNGSTARQVPVAPFVETFDEDVPKGRVIGSKGPGGMIRHGRDVEHQISIDNGALRFRPLIRPGWGRQGIAYGPFDREHGLTFAVSITNGHNTSQGSTIPEGIHKRIARWAVGPNADPPLERGFQWLKAPRKRETLRRIVWWARSRPRTYRLPDFNENLALGWFTSEAPGDPVSDGCCFVMHAAEGENGELWARVAGRCLAAFRRVKNLRIYYLVTLRERGAVYYAAAAEGAAGFGAFPKMRPIAIDPFNDDDALYAGIHQCVLGQIGWRVDTLTHGLHIGKVPEFSPRFGTAHVGHTLSGDGPLEGHGAGAEAWTVARGRVHLTPEGARNASPDEALATIDPGETSGLAHVLVETDDPAASAGLAWRLRDSRNYWLLKVSPAGCALVRVEDGVEAEVASDPARKLEPGVTHSVQVLDAHGQISCYLDGERLFNAWVDDRRLEDATGLGLWLGPGGGAALRDFEAHAREVPMPAGIGFGAPWSRFGSRLACEDGFAGPAGDLAGRKPDTGEGIWQKTVGKGSFGLTGQGSVRVQGTVASPHPNRTFYTLPWSDPGFADIEAVITPPGTGRGEQHRGRSGLVFWQDRGSYLSLTSWLDDIYDGASISVFPKHQGFEELYDAVWTMVWHKIYWGRPYRLRCTFDGHNFTIFVDGEPIMQRSLADLYPNDPPLRITRVGIAVNWEWGCDTGSIFESFTARS